MTYTEEVTDRVQKITEEIAAEWMDHRLAEGRAPAYAGSDDDLRAVRADLLSSIVDSINDIEGIDEELKRRADKRAADEAAFAEMRKTLDAEIKRLAAITRTPNRLIFNGYSPTVGWLDEIATWNQKTPIRSSFSRYYL